MAIFDQQIAALKTRLENGEKIVALCQQGVHVLENAPAATLGNIGEVVGAISRALAFLLQSNLMANQLSLKEISQQCEQLEKARQQRSAKVHLGGFVPAAPRRG